MLNTVAKIAVAYSVVVFLLRLNADAEIIRTPNFPPKPMILAYKSFSKACREESQVTQESIDKFNNGEDMDKLPDDQPLKCYMRCQMVFMEMMDPNAPIIKHDTVVENIHAFSDRDKDIFLNMGKRCTRVKSKVKEACDLAYVWNKCLKKADINSWVIL